MHRKIRCFRDLEIWRRSMQLVKEVYSITKGFPKEELYGLVSQMRRSAVSIPSNIAEGFARRHDREYRQFLFVTLGSLAELSTQAAISEMLGYLDNSKVESIEDEIEQLSRMTRSLIKRFTDGLAKD